MKSMFLKAILTLVVLASAALAGDSTAVAQGSATIIGYNGPGFMRTYSTLTGLDTLLPAHRTIFVSNNPTGSPILGSTTDAFVVTPGVMNFWDSVLFGVPFPNNYYYKVVVTQTDTFGVTDTATALSYAVTGITPAYVPVWDSLLPPVSGTISVSFGGNYKSGFDTAYAWVYLCVGFLDFSSPYWGAPAAADTVYPVYGTANQNVFHTVTFPVGWPNTRYSYRVVLHRKHSSVYDTSIVYADSTLAAPAAATVTTPYSVYPGIDSIAFSADVNTSGLSTVYKMYRATSLLGPAVDSASVIVPAGGVLFTEHSVFHSVPPASNSWIWCTVKDSLNLTPFASTRVYVATLPTIDSFTIYPMDSSEATDFYQQTLHFHVMVPSGHLVSNLTWGISTSIGGPFLDYGSLPTVYSGITTFSVPVSGLTIGTTYYFTEYGSDTPTTRFYSAYNMVYSFTFESVVPTALISVSSSSIPYGSTVNVAWNNLHTLTATVNGMAVSPVDSMTLTLTHDTTLIDAASGPGGSDTATITVHVGPPPVADIISLTADSLTATLGCIDTIRYTTDSATLVKCNGAVVPLSGAFPVGPLMADTTLAFIAYGIGGNDTQSIHIHIDSMLSLITSPDDFIVKDFNIYPNPTFGDATIECHKCVGKIFSVQNMLGQTVKKIPRTGSKTIFQRGDLPPGIYVIDNCKVIIQ